MDLLTVYIIYIDLLRVYIIYIGCLLIQCEFSEKKRY